MTNNFNNNILILIITVRFWKGLFWIMGKATDEFKYFSSKENNSLVIYIQYGYWKCILNKY